MPHRSAHTAKAEIASMSGRQPTMSASRCEPVLASTKRVWEPAPGCSEMR